MHIDPILPIGPRDASMRVLHVLAAAMLLPGAITSAGAKPPPYTHVVENARVTRLSGDDPVHRDHRICVEHPLPEGGFDPAYVDIRLRGNEPGRAIDVLLKPVLQRDGRVCADLAGAVAAEAGYTIEIRDLRRFYDQVLYYSGPLLEIERKK